MIVKVDHIGVAVKALERSLPLWAEALGLELAGVETVEGEQVKVAFLEAGETRIELLEPTGSGSAVAKHLAKRGEGIHHLTFAVRDLHAAIERLRARGVEVVGDGPRVGASGRGVAFLHPRSTGGVLIELVEGRGERGAHQDLVPGAAVLLYLHDPQEKLWGVLRRLDATGVVVEGIDLGSFEDWMAQIERDEESVVGPSVIFVPMVRLEKILLDRSSGHLPSLAERFERRVGRTVQDVLDASG